MLDGLLEFKTDRQREEWESGQLSKKLKWIVRVIAVASYYVFNKKVVITDIFRTQQENEKIYGWAPGSRKKRPVSVHSFWRGIDLRVIGNKRKSHYKKAEAKTIARIGNAFLYDTKRPNKKTAVYGDQRHSNHIHLQVLS